MPKNVIRTLTISVALSFAMAAVANSDEAADKCEALKNEAAGKYAACSAKARSKYILSADEPKWIDAQARCDEKMTRVWDKRETAAADGSACPSVGDRTLIAGVVHDCELALADDLADIRPFENPIAECVTGLEACSTGLEECEADVDAFVAAIASCNATLQPCLVNRSDCLSEYLGCDGYPTGVYPLRTGETVSYGTGSDGSLQLGTARSFTDNGDGTITDNVTGLMWEKKDDAGGIHDKDNRYEWCPGNSCIEDDWAMSGAITTTFLATLNGGGGFAGHTDWRIPNLSELETLRNVGAARGSFPEFDSGCVASCTVATCSCTPAGWFAWTSTTYDGFRGSVYVVGGGQVYTLSKSQRQTARAVRNAL